MNEVEREQIKTELMRAGFWDEDNIGDPTAEDAAATKLYYELECLLREGVYLNFAYERDLQHQELCIRRGDFVYALPEGENRNEAICLAALVLPEFLRLCPEYAAGESLALA
jgi:hypothetical protein